MVLINVGQSQRPVSLRSAVNSLSPGFALADGVLAAGSGDGLLNGLNWSVSYVDSCFPHILEPEAFIDFGSPPVNIVEDDGNRSVRFHLAWLRDVVSGNAAGHLVIAFVALRHPPEGSYGVRDDGSVEV